MHSTLGRQAHGCLGWRHPERQSKGQRQVKPPGIGESYQTQAVSLPDTHAIPTAECYLFAVSGRERDNVACLYSAHRQQSFIKKCLERPDANDNLDQR